MPYQRIPYQAPQPNEDLVRELATELAVGQESNAPDSVIAEAADAPDILEEETRLGSRYVTVIWNRWADLPIESRGRVILDAYQEAQGEAAMRTISVAMGLTRAEASRLGMARRPVTLRAI